MNQFITNIFFDLPPAVPVLLAFIFGSLIGSFLNVLTWRLPREESIQGRSKCPHCGHQLVWHDLVPIFSILLQRGKCKYCGKPISLRYPLMEVLVGALFALAFWLFPVVDLPSAVLYIKIAIVISICVVTFIIDLEHYLILDRVVFPAIGLMLVSSLVTDLFTTNFSNILESLLVGAITFIVFWLMWYLSKPFTGQTGQWMGLGDVKFVAFMGAALGWPGILVAMFVSFTVGAIVGIILILLGKKEFSSKLPFGTFLSAATIIALFWAPQLIASYWSFFGLS